MSEYKYKIPVYQIVDDGDLKFLFFYNTNFIPNVNDSIVNLIQDENGKYIRRLYLKVQQKLWCTTVGDTGYVNELSEESVILHVVLEADEPV